MVQPDGTNLDGSYWEQKWLNNDIKWDIGYASPPIVTYMETYSDKDAAILIPGCGNAYEGAWLVEQGFSNVTILDISATAIANARQANYNQNSLQFVCADFFDFEGQFDLILEQTFFCALPVAHRNNYSQKIAKLLNKSGRLVGVLFNREFSHVGPPFGGNLTEYITVFEKHFKFNLFEHCYNSIPARSGTELFINLSKK